MVVPATSGGAEPPPEEYGPVESAGFEPTRQASHEDVTRRVVIYLLLGILAGDLALSAILLALEHWTGDSGTSISTFMTSSLAGITGLVGAATGFYFRHPGTGPR